MSTTAVTIQNQVNIVAGCKPWAKDIFYSKIIDYPGTWIYVETPMDLIKTLNWNDPEYIFFLHWNWKVPVEIVDGYECVCFHVGDLPGERGGSPVQNLIMKGKKQTNLNALKMWGDIDAGPVYLFQTVSLEGKAEEIYRWIMDSAADMILEIITKRIIPTPQEGEPGWMKRRKPVESKIPFCTLTELYNFIRMLDAQGYPHAYIDGSGFRFEFTDAVIEGDVVTGNVEIRGIT